MLRLIPADRLEEEQQILARIGRGGEGIKEFETVRIRKNGTTIAVWVSVAAIKDVHGKIIGISKIARDITLRSLTPFL